MIQDWIANYAKTDPNILQYTVGNDPSLQDCIVHPGVMVTGTSRPVIVDRKLFCPGVKCKGMWCSDPCYKVCLVSTVYPSLEEGLLWPTPTNWLLKSTSSKNVKSAFTKGYWTGDTGTVLGAASMYLCYE